MKNETKGGESNGIVEAPSASSELKIALAAITSTEDFKGLQEQFREIKY